MNRRQGSAANAPYTSPMNLPMSFFLSISERPSISSTLGSMGYPFLFFLSFTSGLFPFPLGSFSLGLGCENPKILVHQRFFFLRQNSHSPKDLVPHCAKSSIIGFFTQSGCRASKDVPPFSLLESKLFEMVRCMYHE